MPNHESSVTRCSPRFNLCVSSFDYRLEARSSQRQLKVHVGTPAQRHALELVHTSQSATETSIRVRKTHRCASNSQLDHLLTRREKEQTENEDDKEGPGIRNSPREKVARSLAEFKIHGAHPVHSSSPVIQAGRMRIAFIFLPQC